MTEATKIAFVGCGFVADYYMATLNAYPNLKLLGVFDKDPRRLQVFSNHYSVKAYTSLAEVLGDDELDIVVNLTNPRAHYDISKQCLVAGKHVYSEKPLAMDIDEARELVTLAKSKNLIILSAPSSVLGKAARTLSNAVKSGICGKVRLVYAEIDDGLVHTMPYKKWFSESGAPWPYRDEFEVGCTLEHAGYCLTWLIEIFGKVKSITTFADCLVPEKLEQESPQLNPANTPDFSIGVLKFESGVVVRLTTSIIAPHDHSIKVFGDKGRLYVKEAWDNNERVVFNKILRIRRKQFVSPIGRNIKPPNSIRENRMSRGNTKMDFLLGVNNLARKLNKQPHYDFFNMEFCLLITEISLKLNSLSD